MKNLEFNVIKKNRKYFKCDTHGYPCSILIDEKSKDLTIGKHKLLVDSASEYGEKRVYTLRKKFGSSDVTSKLSLFTENNRYFIDECKKAGAICERRMYWNFSIEDKALFDDIKKKYKMDKEYFYLTAKQDIEIDFSWVEICGYRITTRISYKFDEELDLELKDGGGIVKYRNENDVDHFKIAEGTKIKFKLSKNLLKYVTDEWEIS